MTGLWASGVTKTFGSVTALAQADFGLLPGEIHAIVGENGAGKSTLAKILAGVYPADAGSIQLDGKPVTFRRRQDAIAAGIGFLPQALSLVGALSLVENEAIGGSGLYADLAEARAKLKASSARTGIVVPLDTPTGRLSLVERQLGELLIALAQDARFLLLDEPTSMLGPHDVERLVRCLRDLASNGVAIGLVTHRISEVLGTADKVTVLRGGHIVHRGAAAGLTTDAVARLMIGERSLALAQRDSTKRDTMRLRAEAITVVDDGFTVLDGIDLSVEAGEILGVAGVAGAAQPALAAVLAGIRKPTQGRVTFDGADITGAARRANLMGLAHIPDDRGAGVVAEHSVAVNASLLQLTTRAFRRAGLRRPRSEQQYGSEICRRYDVRPPLPGLRAGGLSGGNQQKLLLGRELDRAPKVIVAHSPTQGLDLAATAAAHNRFIDAAARGAAVILISADLDELVAVADRLVVLSAGRVVDDVDLKREAFDPARIGAAMAESNPGETRLQERV